ncbi:hypothetical protein [Frigoriglobus tundricola]|uniref:Uncharacterized protein n=1 Tax=Frigoriglobus tundricola TaxID=2774151 RepID=A0A6M5YXR1_9BACT|nr:hypothetical protein [Frigoriglobus tundricola]QJW98176.1 hypothetical protein FTUN_5756 [Frigoriglobus tundricola]
MKTVTRVRAHSKARRKRHSPHTRHLLRLVREFSWCVMLVPNFGPVKITKREARYQIRTRGDQLTYQRVGRDMLLEVLPW